MKQRLVVCITNKGYPASLEPRKDYVALKDSGRGEAWVCLRVIDESGEDDLFPKEAVPGDRPTAANQNGRAIGRGCPMHVHSRLKNQRSQHQMYPKRCTRTAPPARSGAH